METIAILKTEYNELKRKAEAYDALRSSLSKGGKVAGRNLTPEQRSARAKKAVAARIAKYGQKPRK